MYVHLYVPGPESTMYHVFPGKSCLVRLKFNFRFSRLRGLKKKTYFDLDHEPPSRLPRLERLEDTCVSRSQVGINYGKLPTGGA